MTWNHVASGDHDTIKKSIKLCVDTALEHGTSLGHSDGEHVAVAGKLAKKMKTGGLHIRHQPHHMEDNKKGAVSLIFHRMNWLSQFHKPDITGPVWVITFAFDQKIVFPYASDHPKTKDEHYEDFLDSLNDDAGPVRTFLRDNKLTSIYLMHPVGGPLTDDKRHINRLERVALSWLQKAGKRCHPQKPVTIDSSYEGVDPKPPHAAVPIPKDILQHWGSHTKNEFNLTEIKVKL